ncbi:MAG: DUF3829 domain-containing protein [Myxococcota bacterium]
MCDHYAVMVFTRPSLPLWLALSLTAVGCDRLTQAIENKAEEVAGDMKSTADGSAVPPVPEATDNEKLARKLALYLECTNRASKRMHESWLRYTERAKDNGTPKKKSVPPFLYKIDSELTPCREAATKGPTTEPSLPSIEAAMASYLEHAEAFAAQTVTLDEYYEQEKYKEDDWALAKEVAPKFAAAYEAWSAADERLGTIVRDNNDVVERKVLVEVEEREGRAIEWQSRYVMLAAKDFVRCATADEGKADRCEYTLTTFEKAEQSFRRYYDDHRSEADHVFWMNSFQRSVGEFLADGQAFMRDLKKGEAKPERSQALASAFDDLAIHSNNLRFKR